jgi:hypothetical protein
VEVWCFKVLHWGLTVSTLVVKSTTFVSLVTVNNELPESFYPLRTLSSNFLACAQTTEFVPLLIPSNDSIIECRALACEICKD